MNRIGVFCSSKSDIKSSYKEAALALGEWIGARKKTLVYGGSRSGLMEILAQGVKSSGGRVFGVIPEIVITRGLVSDCIDVEFRCENLSDRKDIMIRESDCLIALPGGVGTLDEVFSTVASNTIGYHNKRTFLFNVDGFWDSTARMIEGMQSEGVVNSDIEERLCIVNSLEELEKLLEG